MKPKDDRKARFESLKNYEKNGKELLGESKFIPIDELNYQYRVNDYFDVCVRF